MPRKQKIALDILSRAFPKKQFDALKDVMEGVRDYSEEKYFNGLEGKAMTLRFDTGGLSRRKCYHGLGFKPTIIIVLQDSPYGASSAIEWDYNNFDEEYVWAYTSGTNPSKYVFIGRYAEV